MWRRKYNADIFGGLLKTLREVEFNRREFNPPVYTQVIEERETEEDIPIERRRHRRRRLN
jgi:hypothetical protein